MRNALGLMLASVVAAVVIAAGGWFYYSARADQGAPKTTAARAADQLPAQAKLAAKDDVETTAAIAARPTAVAQAAAPAPAPAMPVQPKQACANPNALGVARVVEIDTTGGPGFGFDHFKQFDFLTDKEVVLTFDDGPWPVNTPAVLKALADECTKGLFFSVGKHATYHPEILRQVLAQGHTVGTHTWSHVNLNGKKMTEQQAKDEVEKGISAVKFALGTNPAPFFRFPQLQHNPAIVSYFGTRNVAMFSTDIDSFDFRKGATPEKIIETVMTRLDKLGKGIILMHDFQKHTGEAMPALLARLKAGGYKVVQMKAKTTLQTLPEYDEALMKDMKVPTASTNTRPISSVVQTVSQ
ncbi:polysaccharide deacetylase family protein [Bradyrhizobium japonicum]|uniref:polysaccharide deacetylase family protein n=1 Tax=Bradyrhizobium japonicum TaxID=375 RepID=UPI00057F1ABF|nr:polysaccharide deacetylase family protein [Bradyrhizobium japonicum]MCD9107683.1 polysaccharide deacetylase family protein [Bradyrhizobium japonicum]MCD9252088.1 polysaccharide deacetylase family protein [Bradyrhizobium japonicum SEMIA 5079]MCD9816547.1 polysaccharide deacetylase family protein [Bradyrhizobium japonicum]MCD9893055.1 polysaccharide deacetylase family protein [Bradyrhizobium japonicum]MCD9908277.1 polysaccharide deacetylase family protein [Bradyrhizobium japonicum]